MNRILPLASTTNTLSSLPANLSYQCPTLQASYTMTDSFQPSLKFKGKDLLPEAPQPKQLSDGTNDLSPKTEILSLEEQTRFRKCSTYQGLLKRLNQILQSTYATPSNKVRDMLEEYNHILFPASKTFVAHSDDQKIFNLFMKGEFRPAFQTVLSEQNERIKAKEPNALDEYKDMVGKILHAGFSLPEAFIDRSFPSEVLKPVTLSGIAALHEKFEELNDGNKLIAAPWIHELGQKLDELLQKQKRQALNQGNSLIKRD